MLRANPELCIDVDHVKNIANGRSVIAWGRFEELRGDAALDAMQRLVLRFTHLMTGEGDTPTHGTRPSGGPHVDASVFRNCVDEKDGKIRAD